MTRKSPLGLQGVRRRRMRCRSRSGRRLPASRGKPSRLQAPSARASSSVNSGSLRGAAFLHDDMIAADHIGAGARFCRQPRHGGIVGAQFGGALEAALHVAKMRFGAEVGTRGHMQRKFARRIGKRNAASAVRRRCESREFRPSDGSPPSLIASAFDLESAPERADQAVANDRFVRGWRGRAPHRLRPGGVAMAACDDMHMQLRHHVAERGDIELLAFGDGFERARRGGDFAQSCTCSSCSRSMSSTRPGRRGTRISQG